MEEYSHFRTFTVPVLKELKDLYKQACVFSNSIRFFHEMHSPLALGMQV